MPPPFLIREFKMSIRALDGSQPSPSQAVNIAQETAAALSMARSPLDAFCDRLLKLKSGDILQALPVICENLDSKNETFAASAKHMVYRMHHCPLPEVGDAILSFAETKTFEGPKALDSFYPLLKNLKGDRARGVLLQVLKRASVGLDFALNKLACEILTSGLSDVNITEIAWEAAKYLCVQKTEREDALALRYCSRLLNDWYFFKEDLDATHINVLIIMINRAQQRFLTEPEKDDPCAYYFFKALVEHGTPSQVRMIPQTMVNTWRDHATKDGMIGGRSRELFEMYKGRKL